MAGLKPLRKMKLSTSGTATRAGATGNAEQSLVSATLALQEHAEQLDKIEVLNGQLVRGTFVSGGATPGYQEFRHSLGRAPRGAMLCGTGAAAGTTYSRFVVQDPAQSATEGFDTKNYVVVVVDAAPSVDHEILLWVF